MLKKVKPDKKRILLISVADSWGGGEQFIFDLFRNIESYDYLILTSKGKASELFKYGGLFTKEVASLKKIDRENQKWSLSAITKIIFYLKLNLFLLLIEIKKYNPELIIFNGNMAGLYAYLPTIFSGTDFIVIQHLIYSENSLEFKIINLLIKKAKYFICVSKSVAKNISIGIKNERNKSKLRVIYNGVQSNQNALELSDKQNKIIKLGFVGTLRREKGFELVLEALKMIPSEYAYYLNVFGSFGNDEQSNRYKNTVLSKIKEYNLSDKIIFFEFIPDKIKIYSQIDILINYSFVIESFSYVILEAMSLGKIVIAANDGGPRELITSNENGFLVEPRDPRALAEKIMECLHKFHSDELNNLRLKAFKTAKYNFDLGTFVKNYEQLFDSILVKMY